MTVTICQIHITMCKDYYKLVTYVIVITLYNISEGQYYILQKCNNCKLKKSLYKFIVFRVS